MPIWWKGWGWVTFASFILAAAVAVAVADPATSDSRTDLKFAAFCIVAAWVAGNWLLGRRLNRDAYAQEERRATPSTARPWSTGRSSTWPFLS